MMLEDLFKRDNVEFPEWLTGEELDDEWEDATYLKGETIHKWELDSIFGFKSITFEDETYTFTAYDNNNNVVFVKEVTPEYEVTS